MRLGWGRLAAALLMATALGCDPPPDEDAGIADVGIPHDGIVYDGTLELGEGEASFRAIEDGDTLLIARGCQGSQHVWITLRSRDLDPRGMTVRLDLLQQGSEERVSLEFFVRLSFDPDTGGDYAELRALTLQVPMPDDAIGEPLIVRAEVYDRGGHGARAERNVQIDWGTEVCGG
jgi:hypothetical protein